ncbi:ROK family protein [uncultured Marinococcus sp.]|uniref:ROK family protein n=1 Tax=uncultured Marinococcus sp. TaxID=487012 RepID=UPI002634CEFF|nr:ROK family protein [uncultured Marinococcus sp.]
MKTGDQGLVRKINKSIVLNKIQTESPVSRAQISKITGLNKATVSSLVSELMEEHFVGEIGVGLSSGGRRPTMLFFNKNAGYSIGVDLGVNYILAVITDLQGNIINKQKIETDETEPEIIFLKVKNLIRLLQQEASGSPYGLVGIGLGVPGMIDNNGLILFAPNLNWHRVDLKKYLEKEFRLPVTIENEAKAGAHGEKIYGAGQNVSDLIYVSIGIGIGAGIIINDRLHKGSTGISGEIGHVSIDSQGKKCPCGNRGCWELYSSEAALMDKVRPIFPPGTRINLEMLIKMAMENHHGVLNALDQIGEYIGIVLTNIVNTFNPEQIIIGNRFAVLEPWLRNPIQRVLQQRLLPYYHDSFELKFSEHGMLSCALGCAAFSIEQFFSESRVTVV